MKTKLIYHGISALAGAILLALALRVLIMAAAITALYGVAYLPWYLKDRKAKKQEVAV